MGARLLLYAWLCAYFTTFAPVSNAAAQSSRFLARASLDAATMLSRDQLGRLAYDRVGFLASVQIGYAALARLDLTLGVDGGGFFSSSEGTGGLVAPTVGLLAHAKRGGLVPYALAEAGPGITGTVTRPFIKLGAGLEIPISPSFALGPAAGYGHLVQTDHRAGSSTDARYIWAGLAILYQHLDPPTRTAKAPTTRIILVHETSAPPVAPVQDTTPELMALLEQALPNPTARVELLAPVLFAYDSDRLEPVGVAMLHEVARELAARPDIALLSIQGYADRRGSAEYNRALSQKRAERVLAWLVEHGVAPERLQVEAEGATHFVEPGAAEPDHEQNRRVVFRVLKTDPP